MAKNYYEQYLISNKALWEGVSSSAGSLEKKVILIDLLVLHPPYLHGILLVAKYLQMHTHARIVGVVSSSESIPRLQGLLQSFGITEVLPISDQFQKNVELPGELIDRLQKANSPNEYRELVLGTTISDSEIGYLLYDSMLRELSIPTLKSYDERILRFYWAAINYDRVFQEYFNENEVIATVQGHVIYLMYGMMAHVALRNGATVYGRKPGTNPSSIRRYRCLSEIKAFEIDFSKKDFDYVYKNKKDEALKLARQYMKNRFSGKKTPGTNPYVPESFSSEKKAFSRKLFSEKVGTDNDKPYVFLMCHQFSDAPHCDYRDMIHHDYYDWLEDTLSIVSNIEGVNWVVKPHPEDKYYSKKDCAVELTEKFMERFDNIYLCPTEINTRSLLEIADIVVTVRGSATIEFPAHGIPCITTGAGKSCHPELGFTISPSTRSEYVDTLKNIRSIKKLSQEQIEKALVCCYCFQYLSRVESVYLPCVANASWVKFNEDDYWKTSLEAIEKYSVKEDPLYQNFNIQLANDFPQLMRYDELGILN